MFAGGSNGSLTKIKEGRPATRFPIVNPFTAIANPLPVKHQDIRFPAEESGLCDPTTGSRALIAGAPMKPCFLTLTLIAGCATLAAPAFAQSALPQVSAAATAMPKPAAGAPRAAAVVAAASADGRAPVRTPGSTSFTAAGSVIILADGIVANATNAQILPPAPGFAYDR